MALDKVKIAQLGSFYRHHLLEDVMPFWEKRTKDDECGGYLTCFDQSGKVTDTDKYIWFQGRQLWMFSALYNQVEKRQSWLELARHGRDFLLKYAYAGNGRWFYQTDRNGTVKEKTISIFTDHFMLASLCEYALATGSDEDMPLIHLLFAEEFHHHHLQQQNKMQEIDPHQIQCHPNKGEVFLQKVLKNEFELLLHLHQLNYILNREAYIQKYLGLNLIQDYIGY